MKHQTSNTKLQRSTKLPRTALWPVRTAKGWTQARLPVVEVEKLAVEYPGPCAECGAYYGHHGFCKKLNHRGTEAQRTRQAEKEFYGV